MTFVLSFLGALFAIFVALLVVYTYVTLRLAPRLKRDINAFIKEMGPKAIFERAGVSPEEAMQSAGLDPTSAHAAVARSRGGSKAPSPDMPSAVRVVFTCEDHGRCVGCPKVLAQFEAIIRHQGEDSFDEVEKKLYAQLCEQIASDAPLDGEHEPARQHRIATRVVEVLVREGFTTGAARSAVWACRKEDRATYVVWLSAARAGCSAIMDAERTEERAS
jgi:hypothetical protein